MNGDVIRQFKQLFLFPTGFWSGNFTRAGLLLERKFFPKVVSLRQYLQGLMHSQKSAFKFLHWKDTHCHFLKLKLVAQELYNQAAQSISKQGNKPACFKVGEKGEQHLKTSDIPLTDNWAWNQSCTIFSLTGATPLNSTLSLAQPVQLPDTVIPCFLSQLPPILCSQSQVSPFKWFSSFLSYISHSSDGTGDFSGNQANFPDKPNSSPLSDQPETKSLKNQPEVWNTFLIMEIWLRL